MEESILSGSTKEFRNDIYISWNLPNAYCSLLGFRARANGVETNLNQQCKYMSIKSKQYWFPNSSIWNYSANKNINSSNNKQQTTNNKQQQRQQPPPEEHEQAQEQEQEHEQQEQQETNKNNNENNHGETVSPTIPFGSLLQVAPGRKLNPRTPPFHPPLLTRCTRPIPPWRPSGASPSPARGRWRMRAWQL